MSRFLSKPDNNNHRKDGKTKVRIIQNVRGSKREAPANINLEADFPREINKQTKYSDTDSNQTTGNENHSRDGVNDKLTGENPFISKSVGTHKKASNTSITPCWKKFNARCYKAFRKRWFHFMQDNKNVKINDLATMLCKFQSIIFFDDLFELSNAEIIKKCDLHFGYLDAYDVVARLYESKINKKLNKPCLATIDDYINRFSTVLYSTDEELWPQPNLTLDIFINGIEPQSAKVSLQLSNPVDLRAACHQIRDICKNAIQSDAVQDIVFDNKEVKKRERKFRRKSISFSSSLYERPKDFSTCENWRKNSQNHVTEVVDRSSLRWRPRNENGEEDYGMKPEEAEGFEKASTFSRKREKNSEDKRTEPSAGTKINISDVFINHDKAIDIPNVIYSIDDVQSSLNNKNMKDSLSLDSKSHRSVNDGMVFHHHQGKLDVSSKYINVDQVALRLDQLDSLRSRKGDRITDCHPQSSNVDYALNREVHGSRILDLDRDKVDTNVDSDSADKIENRRDSIDSFIDNCSESRIIVDSEIDLNRNLNVEIDRNKKLGRINLDAEIDVDSHLFSKVDKSKKLNRNLIRCRYNR